ncbi:MAG TPA: hypothetical protein PLB62_01095 [Candidatus Sumerlaeota bacterium]|nr:hypothetical protein [Candidatus Sumerlaeota bacterium]
MWKKFLIGCGVVFVLFVILIAVGVTFVVVRTKQFAERIGKTTEQYKATNTSYPFTPPEPALMDEARLQTFIRVRDTVRAKLEAHPDLIEQMKEMDKKGQKSARAAFKGVIDMVNSSWEASQAHIEALHENRMSIKEYVWYNRMVTGTILEAAKKGVALDEDLITPYKNFMEGPSSETKPAEQKAPDYDEMKNMFGVQGVELVQENLDLVLKNREALARMKKISFMQMFMQNMDLDQMGTKTGEPAPLPAPPDPSSDSPEDHESDQD